MKWYDECVVLLNAASWKGGDRVDWDVPAMDSKRPFGSSGYGAILDAQELLRTAMGEDYSDDQTEEIMSCLRLAIEAMLREKYEQIVGGDNGV